MKEMIILINKFVNLRSYHNFILIKKILYELTDLFEKNTDSIKYLIGLINRKIIFIFF